MEAAYMAVVMNESKNSFKSCVLKVPKTKTIV
jgi:hypothetical protein